MTDTPARALASDDRTIDRRKLLKMGVWAAPVVVLATAAPAAAASQPTVSQSTVIVPATATQAPAASGGNRVSIRLRATVAAAVNVTAVMQITALNDDKGKPSTLGAWDAPSGATGTSASIVRSLAAAGELDFEFVYKVATPNDNYSYTIVFSWGPTNEFTKSVAGTIG
ncbi:hypothetical protein B1729_03010 [Microbacterium sp. B35-04]|uniref:hypothetical protein n=1 Tax=Microbacterium sp. B35-04 TaxID=1961716 RepID=UPI0013D1398E|nr:hypothetical protein [Microbacterium sp. B35-04]KAF2414816.1 hypothetical protein B1729_03010 [Microbacterium sp. B35-04]